MDKVQKLIRTVVVLAGLAASTYVGVSGLPLDPRPFAETTLVQPASPAPAAPSLPALR